jgi:glutamate/aspartate transport system permease protein
LPTATGDWLKAMPNSPFVFATLSLGFFTSARVAVQVSTGINALPRGQRMAGVALGLTLPQTYRYVLLPMAFRIIIPALTNELAAIIKNSSVALTIGLMELTAQARSMQEMSFQVFEAFTAATLIYLAVSGIAIVLSNLLEKKTAVPGFITTGTSAGGH